MHVAGLYGGSLLGVKSVSGLAFYDWESTDLIRRIEITPKHVWNCPLQFHTSFPLHLAQFLRHWNKSLFAESDQRNKHCLKMDVADLLE